MQALQSQLDLPAFVTVLSQYELEVAVEPLPESLLLTCHHCRCRDLLCQVQWGHD